MTCCITITSSGRDDHDQAETVAQKLGNNWGGIGDFNRRLTAVLPKNGSTRVEQ